MWQQTESPKVLKATKSVAKRFQEMEKAPNDRNVNGDRLDFLGKALADGTFRTCEWASALCKETGKEYRINGKHTSLLMSQMNGELDGLSVIVERYECDTLEDAAQLYATFDTRQSSRSTGDINRAFAASHPELDVLASKLINLSVTGISFALWEGHSRSSAAERASLMLVNRDFILWLNELLHGPKADSRHLRRGAIAAAMYRTWQKSQKASRDFWLLVRDGSGPKNTTADRTLNKYLLRTSVNLGSGAKTGKDRALPREMYVKCIHAWNAWRREEVTDLKYYPAAKTPNVI